MTPLEKALQRHNTKSCLTCKDRAEIGGISYCQIDGKMIHPLLLNKHCYTRCPTEEQRGGREVEINDRNEVIRELQTEIENATYPDRPRSFMFPLWLAEKVLELLKAQEPRVMTPTEAYTADFVYIEFAGIITPALRTSNEREGHRESYFATQQLGGDWMRWDDYGKTWRCWTSQPDDATREATPWMT